MAKEHNTLDFKFMFIFLKATLESVAFLIQTGMSSQAHQLITNVLRDIQPFYEQTVRTDMTQEQPTNECS